MDIGIYILIALLVCGIIHCTFRRGNKRTIIEKNLSVLYYSSNKNSYECARDVFKILEGADIKIKYLEEYDERK